MYKQHGKIEVTPTCDCVCKTCTPNETYCPTTKQCIDSSKWCDGIVDCEDDEMNCPVSTTRPTTITTIAAEVTTTLPPATTGKL